MPLHRPLADVELLPDGPVGRAGGDQPDHFQLAGRESVRVAGRRTSAEGLDPGAVGLGSEPLEDRAGGAQFHLGGVLVLELAAGEPDEDPDACGGVGRPELFPGRPGGTQRVQRGPGIALGQAHRALRAVREGT